MVSNGGGLVVGVEIGVAMGLALWVWLEMAGFFWVLVGMGFGCGDRCGRGDWCGS